MPVYQSKINRSVGLSVSTSLQSGMKWPIWEVTLLIAAVAAQLSLVWVFEYFPTVDGPAHLHLAHGFREALGGDAFYQNYFQLNERLNPNILTQTLLLALNFLVPPFVAEKIWLSIYIIGFAVASAYVLTGFSRAALCLLPLLVFCSVSFPLAFGFYNFAFSSVVFLAWFGFWWRTKGNFSIGVILVHAAFAAVAYLTHIFAFVVTLFAMTGAFLGIALFQLSQRHRNGVEANAQHFGRLLLTHAGPPFVGCVPELFAAAMFLFGRYGEQTGEGVAEIGTVSLSRFTDLVTASSFAPYNALETIPALLFLALCTVLLWWLLRKDGRSEGSLAFAICFFSFLMLYVFVPFHWLVRWMPSRIQPFIFIILVLWAAARMPVTISNRHRHIISTAGTLVLLLSVLVRFEIFSKINDYYREYRSVAPFIAENSTLVGLRQGPPFAARVEVLIQAGSRVATARHAVDLKNFQGQSPVHPIQFRPGTSAYKNLGGDRAITAVPPRVDLLAHERTTGQAIDYVLIWGERSAAKNEGANKAQSRLHAQLDRYYRLIYVSEPRGFARLYKRNISVPPGA